MSGTTYSAPTSSGWGWAPKAYSFGATSIGETAATPPSVSVPKGTIRTFRHAVITDYFPNMSTMRHFSHGVITDVGEDYSTIRTFRHAVITDLQNNLANFMGSSRAQIFSIFHNTPNIRSSEKAIMYAKRIDDLTFNAGFKAQLYGSVFNAIQSMQSIKAATYGMVYDQLRMHSVYQSTIFDTVVNSGFVTGATQAQVDTQELNTVHMESAGRAVLSTKDIRDDVIADVAIRATIQASVSSSNSFKNGLLGNVFGSTEDILYFHSVNQSVIFDIPSDFAETKQSVWAQLLGNPYNQVKLSGHTRSVLRMWNPDDPVNQKLHSYGGQDAEVHGAITNSLFGHSFFQSAIFEVSSADTAMLGATQGSTYGQDNNSVKVSTADRAVLWFSNRAYGRRRITYFA